jgi:hypothetical protein
VTVSDTLIDWVTEKLKTRDTGDRLEIVGRNAQNFLIVKAKGGTEFSVAVLGLKETIQASDVTPLFSGATKPQLVINVPSITLWGGAAIKKIHAADAAFGKLGDVARAARLKDPGSFRDKTMGFFINAIEQHTNVSSVSYVYDSVLSVNRVSGSSLTVAVIEAYNMSAEDVRNARTRFGQFDVVVKSSSYGSVTEEAVAAARTMGAQALTFRELMGRLNK